MSACTGFTATLWVGDVENAGTPTYRILAGTTTISLPEREASKVKITTTDQPDHVQHYCGGWADMSTFACEWNFDQALMTDLEGLFGQTYPYRVTYEAGLAQIDGEAYLSKGPSATFDTSDEHPRIKAEFQATGPWVTTEFVPTP